MQVFFFYISVGAAQVSSTWFLEYFLMSRGVHRIPKDYITCEGGGNLNGNWRQTLALHGVSVFKVNFTVEVQDQTSLLHHTRVNLFFNIIMPDYVCIVLCRAFQLGT